jgi:hypothetical protein
VVLENIRLHPQGAAVTGWSGSLQRIVNLAFAMPFAPLLLPKTIPSLLNQIASARRLRHHPGSQMPSSAP